MKFLFVVLLVLLPSLSFTQEGESPEVPVEPNEEDALEELEAHREKRQKVMDSLSKVGEGPEEGRLTLDPEEQLKKMGFNGPITPAALFNPEALKALEGLIKEAKMWEMPEEAVRQQVLKSFEGSAIEGYVKTSPNLLAFMVDFMRDKKALLNSIAIFKDRDRLKTYLYFWIGIMFASFYLKRVFVSKFWKRPTKVFASTMFSLTITVISLSTFCLIFEEEMRPIIALVKKHL